MDWQPIETAPNKQKVLLFPGLVTGIRWDDKNIWTVFATECDPPSPPFMRGWTIDNQTHWMPLPPPPAE